MQRINETNLPEFVELLAMNFYPEFSWNRFGVTELMKGPKEVILNRRHTKEIVEDIADLSAIITGNSIHFSIEYLMEKYRDKLKHEYLAEHRIDVEINGNFPEPVYLSGQLDLLDLTTHHLYDTKSSAATAYAFKVQDGFADWRKQIRTYWWMAERKGYTVKSASNILFNEGFSKYQMRRNPDYPRRSIIEIPQLFNPIITLEESAELNAEYAQKIRTILEYKDAPDDEIPPCSPEERWERDEHWAIMKKGRKRAVSRHTSKEEAEFVMETMSKDHFIEYRPGIPAKCVDYCSANQFCNFYKNYMTVLENKREEA